MKNFNKRIIIYSLLLLPFCGFAQVGINTTTPEAMLDISGTDSGVLIPRVALTSAIDNTTVVNPQGGALVTSTLIYNTATAGTSPNLVTPGFYFWNGSRWVSLSSASEWLLDGNTGITEPALPTNYGIDPIVAGENFLGTTDANATVFATDNIERMRIEANTGNVGIGTANPTNRFHVEESATSTSAIQGTNTYVGTIDGIGVLGNSINSPGYGYGGFFTGGYMGTYAWANGTDYTGTSYGLYVRASGTAGTRIGGYFTAYGGTNNYGIIVPSGGGLVGLGTTAPTARLHVNGDVRIVDGTQGTGKVLTSDANGLASWQDVSINNVSGSLGAGVDIPAVTNAWLQTGSSIVLPPGRWAVNVTMLLVVEGNLTSPNDSSIWVRSTFSTSNGANPTPTTDIEGSQYISGNFPGSSTYGIVTGAVIINNTTSAPRTYYYVAGFTVPLNNTQTLFVFGGNHWQEDVILAYRLD